MFNLHLTHMFIIIINIHLSSSFNPQRFHLRPAEVSIITVCFMLFLYFYLYVFSLPKDAMFSIIYLHKSCLHQVCGATSSLSFTSSLVYPSGVT